jgi:hypothetical protein
MLEDDDTNPPLAEAAPISTPVDRNIESTAELSKATNPLRQEAWYNVEDSCYICDDRPLPWVLDDGLVSTVVEDL